MRKFRDRIEAGIQLADKLEHIKGNSIVLAIPRGGVVVGSMIAKRLNTMLDVVCPRKLGALGNPELAVGAIMHDGTYILNEDIIKYLAIPENYLKEEMNRKREESLKRLIKYRGSSSYELDDKLVILVDDGVATGATVFVVIKWLNKYKIDKLLIAVPVGPSDTIDRLRKYGEVISLLTPYNFRAVGEFYEDFKEVSDEDVLDILKTFK